jgi:hypothetical protein
MENLSDEEKMALAKKCNFNCLLILTTTAICCGLAGTSYCGFAQRDVTLVPGATVAQVCEDAGAAFSSTQQCVSLFNDTAVGFFAWQTVVPENQYICLEYTMAIPGRGYVTLPTDTK